MSNYGIGGNEVQLDASEAFADIPQNRTLFAEKLTKDAPIKPEVVQGLQTVQDVFDRFKPSVEVAFETEQGTEQKETLSFSSVGDFSLKGITAQSPFLQSNAIKKDEYLKIIKQLKSNKILKTALADPTAKAALIAAIGAMHDELQSKI